MTRRVVATGLGVVSCLGADLDEHWRRLVAGETGIRPLDGALAAVLPVRLHAPVVDLRIEERIGNRMLRKLLLPSATFAVIAAGQALADAGLASPASPAGDDARLDACGLYFGSTSYEVAGRTYEPALRASFGADRAFDFARFAHVGMEQVDPLLIVKGLPNAAPCAVAIEHRIHGPNASYTDGQTSGLQAAAAGFRAIQDGIVDLAIVGGSDSLLLAEHFVAHHVAGRLLEGDEQPRVGAHPFDARPRGYVLGEGAAVCVLEAEDHARARGVRVYAGIAGAGETCCANGGSEGLEAAAREALERSGRGTDPDVVFASGLGTPVDDRREGQACGSLFPAPASVEITAATGALGLTGAASGAFSLVHALRSMTSGTIAPTAGYSRSDPSLSVRVVSESRPRRMTRALVWASDGARHVALSIGSMS